MEHVILVDENDIVSGTMEKMEAHKNGALHRAFSIFIFDKNGNMLLQQRAMTKYHSAGLWTNACCSHPRPGESTDFAATRRLREEMGFQTNINKVFDFTYWSAVENGLTEHEFDHVYVGYYNGNIQPDMTEVADYKYMPMETILETLETRPELFTAWFQIAFPRILEWWRSHNSQ